MVCILLTRLDRLTQLSGMGCCVWTRTHFKGTGWSTRIGCKLLLCCIYLVYMSHQMWHLASWPRNGVCSYSFWPWMLNCCVLTSRFPAKIPWVCEDTVRNGNNPPGRVLVVLWYICVEIGWHTHDACIYACTHTPHIHTNTHAQHTTIHAHVWCFLRLAPQCLACMHLCSMITDLLFWCTAPRDYTGGTFSIIIQAGMTMATLSVLAHKDTSCEDDEYFKATLVLNEKPCMVELGPELAFVSITGDKSTAVIMHLCTYMYMRTHTYISIILC